MSNKHLDSVVRHLRQVAGHSEARELTDAELLKRFVSAGDEDAFALLVCRYGRLVRSVCRQVLHHEQDVDDAFQVTFLVLASRAASIRKTTAVASFLYGVAYRTARNAKRARTRRGEQQSHAQGCSREQPFTEAALREVQAILHDEVNALPEKYRAPFVLCCLEGKTRAEAAEELGWKEGTVFCRVARARAELQRRLTRRGVVLTAALCAVELGRTGATAAVRPALVNSTIKAALSVAAGKVAAADLVSAEVAALSKGVLRTMGTTKLKIAAVLLVVSVVAGASLLTRQAPAAIPADGSQAVSPKAPQEKKVPAATPGEGKEEAGKAKQKEGAVVIRGRVLDPDNKPLAGAKLYLNVPDAKESAYPVRATSGADGRFEFRCARSELGKAALSDPWLARWSGKYVMAVARGYGCDWAKVDADGQAGELTLRLVKDVPINGRVLDQDGRGVVGAKVRVYLLYAYPGEDLTEHLAAMRKRVRGPGPSKGWVGPLPDEATVATTTEDGRFRLSGLGRERFVWLYIEGPAIANGHCSVLTRLGSNKPDVVGLHYARFDYVAAPSRPIRGVVRDLKTGKPLAGVGVNFRYGSVVPPPRFTVYTDKEGRYELLGFAKAPKYDLVVRPADGQVYFAGGFEFTDTTGLTPLTADIELVAGIPLRGRVTDKATGKPIPQAVVTYHALFPNAYRSKLPGQYKYAHSETVTGQDGSYSLAVFPGPGVLAVTAARREMYTFALAREKDIKDVFGGARIQGQMEDALLVEDYANGMVPLMTEQHNALLLLNPDEKADSLKRDVVLQRGQTLRGSVVGPDGRPLTGAKVWNTIPYHQEPLEGDTFTVRGLQPGRSRTLLVSHEEKDLAGAVVLRGDEKGPLTVKLQRYGDVTGRLVDANGKPVPKVQLFCRVKGVRIAPPKLTGPGITDKDGRFRVKGLIPGLEHQLGVVGPGPRIVSIVAEPGKTRDLGDVKRTAD